MMAPFKFTKDQHFIADDSDSGAYNVIFRNISIDIMHTRTTEFISHSIESGVADRELL